MGDVTPTADLPLWSDHARFVRRHLALIGALMGVGLLAGLAWSVQQPAAYSATASIAMAPVPVYVAASTEELVPPEVTVDTDAQLLRSGSVLDAIAAAIGTDREGAAERLAVTASANTHVLHVTVTAGTADQAAAAANAAIAAVVDVRRRTLGALQESQMRNLRMLVGNHGGELEGRFDEQDQDLLLSSTDEQLAQILTARASLDELEEAKATPAEVISDAVPPRHADYANTEVALVSGAMLGLVVACLVGAGRDHLRPTGGAAQRGSRRGRHAAPEPTTDDTTDDTTDEKDHWHAS